ncbi:tetratricopeptide repeat protein [Streptomyces sp. NBC_00986]|nr:tetratricopeptide repeat protein [Streptomyces sp. NBC_00986]
MTARDDLAAAHQAAGDPGLAIPLLERTLADRVRVLGEDHPGVMASRINLAGAYQAVGEPGRAITPYAEALIQLMREFGTDHPLTVRVVRTLHALLAERDGGAHPGP